MSTHKKSAYIGDGVYADFDGYDLILRTNDGLRDTNTVVLEPEVLANLTKWLEHAKSELRAMGWRG